MVSLVFVIPALFVQQLFRPTGWGPLAAAVAGCWLPFAACAWRFGLSGAERLRWGRLVPGLFGMRGWSEQRSREVV